MNSDTSDKQVIETNQDQEQGSLLELGFQTSFESEPAPEIISFESIPPITFMLDPIFSEARGPRTPERTFSGFFKTRFRQQIAGRISARFFECDFLAKCRTELSRIFQDAISRQIAGRSSREFLKLDF